MGAAKVSLLASAIATSGCCLAISGVTTIGTGSSGGLATSAGTSSGGVTTVGAGSTTGTSTGTTSGTTSGTSTGAMRVCPPAADAGSCTPGRASNLASFFGAGAALGYCGLVSADLNGDGLLDLVASNAADGYGFDLLFGKSDGGLSAGAHYPGAGCPAVAVGDINGDGLPDVVVADGMAIDVFVNEGGGDLVKKTTIPTASNISSIGIGDLNGDCFADLLFGESMSGSFGAEISLGGPAGTFSAPASFADLDEGASGWGEQIKVADVNGDGLPDIVASFNASAKFGTPQVAVLLNQGSGQFQMTTYDALASLQIGLVPRLNRPPDILTASYSNDSSGTAVGYIQLLANDRAGAFELGQIYQSDPDAGFVVRFAVGDFNGDCIPDVAVTTLNNLGCAPSYATFDVRYGDGDGGFGAPLAQKAAGNTVPVLLVPLGPVTSPRALAAIDACGQLLVYGDTSR